MPVSGAFGRHRVAIASNLALLVAATAVVVVATQADGFRTHEAQLNDGGIWVTNGRDGYHGRLNKPIAQLDGVAFAEQNTQLDVVQDGAAVVGVNVSAGVLTTIDPGKVALPDGETAQLPAAAQVQLAGGTVAVLDPADGTLWAERVDTRVGVPPVGALDSEADPLAATAPDAGLAVSLGGEVLVASASDDSLRRFSPLEAGFAPPTEVPFGVDLGPRTAVTTVGDRAVLLDVDTGTLQVVGGPGADVPVDSTLQVPGPDASSVLVATPDSLVAVDLGTGEAADVVDAVGGRPAAPVRLGACTYGAWSGGSGLYATACTGAEPIVGDLGAGTTDLVFRVNRDEIVLNDRASGAVWDIDTDQPTRLDNWDAFQVAPTEDDEENENENEDQGDRRPPQAEDDDLGARLGRTTVLHPLDNDTAPVGRLLAIASVETTPGSDAELTISPDGQTVQVDLPADAGPVRFDYTIDDGRSGLSDTATVRVTPRTADVDSPPQLREGFEPRVWVVPAGGTLDVPVLPDWRDLADGDPLSLDSAVAAGGERSGAIARTTSAGRVRFAAPARSGEVVVQYAVTDGIGAPVEDELRFQVQDPKDPKAYPGTAEPDVVAGEAGRTVTIRPLANDLPGSDPANPSAQVQLAGKLGQVGGAEVRTDMVDGTISFVADQPRTYFLDYDLRYGNAEFDPGRIRVDVKAPGKPPEAPVAMPDSVTLYGQAATLVDVVANDIDPTGGILVVQGAEADRANAVDVAVVEGRWLRISARQGQLTPNPQLVRYSISNGSRSGIEGEVVVSWRPSPVDNTPVTEADRVVVRAGGSVTVPVLDNDFSPAGDELDLVADLPEQDAGVLVVRPPADDEEVPTGEAFASERFVRYVAPDDLEDAETFTVRYFAVNTAGQRAPGTLEIQVVPAARRNAPPEPPVLESRAVAGDTIKLRLPGAGVDPDGDPVTLTGIDSAPQLGRIVRFGATSLVYQAFPGSVGTDEFGYTVTDPQGAQAVGAVRVAVTSPGTPQAPLAVPDTVTTEPGRTARVDVLANDYVADGDRVEIELVGAPPGVRLETPQGPVLLEAPAGAERRNVEVVYRVGNGIDASQSTVTLRVVDPFNNPPVVFDAFGTPAVEDSLAAGATADGEVDGEGDASTVTVDVLETAYDPDGDTADLRVSRLFAPAGVVASVDGSDVTVERGDQPRVVPFRVVDADGGAATASLYVPPLAGGAPYVVPGAVIRVEPGDTGRFDLADYVVDPAGGPVAFTLRDRISGSPTTGVQPRITGEQAFEVTGAERYAGPGAIVFEVTTGDTVDDPDGIEATLSVPVQVGADDPILSCPTEPIRIAQDRSLDLDVASLCHVWTPDPETAASLSFDADWRTSVDGLVIVQPSGQSIEVNAAGTAEPGSRATLEVSTGGGEPGLIEIVVVRSPPPSLVPIRLDDLRAGQERTVDLASYLRPGVANPEPTVVSVEQVTGLDVQAVADGSSVRLRTGPQVDGRAEFRIVMSDVAGSSGPERQVEGRLVVDVLDVPDAPTAPVPGTAVRDREVVLGWTAPVANGAPVDRYQVRGNGGVNRECAGTTCEIGGLDNGRDYRFEVRAHNSVGWSDWSPRSAVATPDARPGRVGPITLVQEGDTFVKLRWAPPSNDTSRIQDYVVTWQDGGRTTTRRPEVTATGLDNNRAYTFTVYATNETFDLGETRTSDEFQSIGQPGKPAQPTVTEQRTSSDTAAVVVSWPPVDPPNGPGPVRYTVLRDGRPLGGCTDVTATRCTNGGIDYNGQTYQYSVRATNDNGRGKTSTGPSRAFQAVGEPEPWGDFAVGPTGQDNQAKVDFTAPDSNGRRSVVKIYADDVKVGEVEAVGGSSQTVQVANNDTTHRIRLEVCNELDRCSGSLPKDVQTYGPLRDVHILAIEAIPSTRVVAGAPAPAASWRITVDTNGDGALLRVESGQRRQVIEAAAVDVQQFVTEEAEIGYATTETLRVVLEDPSPARGQGTATATYTTGAKPTPMVGIRRGSYCNDGPKDPRCKTGANGDECTNRVCGRVLFNTTGVTGTSVTCSFFDERATIQPYLTRTFRANEEYEPGPYYGYGGSKITVDCDGMPRKDTYVWPLTATPR